MTPEQTNVLKQCLIRGHWTEGLRYLTEPWRAGFYRWRHRSKASPSPSRLLTNLMHDDDEPHTDPVIRDAELQVRGVYRLAGGSYHELRFEGAREWEDPEDAHAYHRLYWAVRYARAFALGHDASAGALERDWLRWTALVQLDQRVSHAAYTVAERLASLAEILFWNQTSSGLLCREMERELRDRIEADACYLARNIEYDLGVHNHLLNDARGLAAAATALPEAVQAPEWQRLAFALWEKYFPVLVLEDGSLSEQSSHYHVLLCRTALEYLRLARTANRALPEGLECRLREMFELANDLWREDGSLPRFGDNSPDRTAEDLAGLLTAAAANGLLVGPVRHSAVTPLSRSYGAAEEMPMSSGMPVRLYAAGGYAFLRCPASGAELAVHAEPDPSPRAHGDAGRGSFELWRGGQVILREPGCYLRPGHARSAWYRGPQAQNVTCLDGLGPAISGDNARLPSWYRPRLGRWHLAPGLGVCFENPAFERLRPGVVVWRTWRFVDGALEFDERVDGEGSVRFESRVFLGDGLWSEVQEGCREWTVTSTNVVIRIASSAGLNVTRERAQYTPEYGVERHAELLRLEGKVNLPMSWSLRCEFEESF